MNIADRHQLYSGIRTVLRPGGRLAVYDFIAGEEGPLQFPVPWARDPADSFLASAEATREALEAAGFAILDWADVTDTGQIICNRWRCRSSWVRTSRSWRRTLGGTCGSAGCASCRADLTDVADLARVETTLRTDASITMLVNNVGVGAGGPLLVSDVDKMSGMIALNVGALTRLTVAVPQSR